jgi:hypothetical protein
VCCRDRATCSPDKPNRGVTHGGKTVLSGVLSAVELHILSRLPPVLEGRGSHWSPLLRECR